MKNNRTSFVLDELKAAGDEEIAEWLANYLKSPHPCFGVPVPKRRVISKKALLQFPISTHTEYVAAICGLWCTPFREAKSLAIDIASAFPQFIDIESLALYEKLIREGAWWDFVDPVAVHLVGRVFLKRPQKVAPIIDAWNCDQDFWIRRTTLICQNQHKSRTDEKRLFQFCLHLAHEKEFFIRKAIGWALRAYSYTAPDAVFNFLKANNEKLSPLSYKEGGKVLKKRGYVL
jgi:3-methyladenine DNA glycosylase AlkD